MNFKLQQTYPSPVEGISNHNVLIHIPKLSSLLLYGASKNNVQAQQQQPKKKITFKANKSNPQPQQENLSLFSLEDRKWVVQEVKGKIPTSRTHYKTITLADCVILYGGKSISPQPKQLNDVYALNFQNWTWKKLFSLDGPPPSDYVLFAKINNISACSIVNENLWILSFKDVKWQLSSNQLPGTVWEKTSIKLPQNPLFCCGIGVDKVIIGGEKEVMVVSTISKQVSQCFECDFSKLNKEEKLQVTAVNEQQLFIANGKQIFVFRMYKDSLELVGKCEIDKKIKCSTLLQNQSISYFLTAENELISVEEELATSRNVIESPQRNSSIIEEENESSLIQSHENESQKKIQRQKSEVNVEEESFRSENEERLKKKLGNILSHEVFKRKLLETKVEMLEDIIKKSQKFVIKLDKYGNNHNKKNHISKVKSIKQDLEFNWGKLAYYRKEMETQRVPSKLKKFIDQPLFSEDHFHYQ